MRKMSDYVDTNPPTTDTPNGTFKNETQPNAANGTDIKAEHMQDPYYALYSILQLAGELPNGELENGTDNRQFLKSLTNIGWFKYDSNITYKRSSIVINTINNITKLYRSQKDNNKAPLTSTDFWINIITINNDNTIEFNSTSTDNAGVFIGAFMYGVRADTPEGWLRCDGTDKPASVFMAFINNFLLTGKIPYKNLIDWQTEYNANNGNCGYFGYQEEILQYQEDGNGNKTNIPILNDNGNTIIIQAGVLRVPCIKDGVYIMQALTGGLGSFTGAGLPNIRGKFSIYNAGNGGAEEAFKSEGGATTSTGRENVQAPNFSFDASRSNTIYGNSSTVQTNAISYPLFICVSNKPVPTSEAQYNGFIDGLNNKVNTDFSNLNIENRSKIINWGIPDYESGIDLTYLIQGQSYTVPYNCWIFMRGMGGDAICTIKYKDRFGEVLLLIDTQPSSGSCGSFYLSKDESFYVDIQSGGFNKTMFKLKGV